jgi:N-methylhydantoinase A/oxoprolinase/acetone carboxylase beta subunit
LLQRAVRCDRTAILRREGLGVGDVIPGPAVIAEREATTWIAPGEGAVVSETGTLEVTW